MRKYSIQWTKSIIRGIVEKAFYGRKEGPEIVITDESTEREALSKMWPNACLPLSIFYNGLISCG